MTDRADRIVLRHHATYLITGGLGGVGFAAARWMGAQWCSPLMLVSRRESSSEIESQIGELESRGAEVIDAQVDVSQSKDVEDLVARIGTRCLRSKEFPRCSIDRRLSRHRLHQRSIHDCNVGEGNWWLEPSFRHIRSVAGFLCNVLLYGGSLPAGRSDELRCCKRFFSICLPLSKEQGPLRHLRELGCMELDRSRPGMWNETHYR